jgi:hypothetical protein
MSLAPVAAAGAVTALVAVAMELVLGSVAAWLPGTSAVSVAAATMAALR